MPGTGRGCCSCATRRSPRRSTSRRRSPTTGAISTAAPSAARSSRTRPTSSSPTSGPTRTQFFTVSAAGLWPQYRGDLQEQAVPLHLYPAGRSPAVAGPVAVLPARAGERVPADHHHGRTDAPDGLLRLRGAPPVGRRRPHLDPERPDAERHPLPVRLQQVRGVGPVQPRVARPRATSATAARRHVLDDLQLPVDRRRRLRQQPDGARAPLAVQGRLLAI